MMPPIDEKLPARSRDICSHCFSNVIFLEMNFQTIFLLVPGCGSMAFCAQLLHHGHNGSSLMVLRQLRLEHSNDGRIEAQFGKSRPDVFNDKEAASIVSFRVIDVIIANKLPLPTQH